MNVMLKEPPVRQCPVQISFKSQSVTLENKRMEAYIKHVEEMLVSGNYVIVWTNGLT